MLVRTHVHRMPAWQQNPPWIRLRQPHTGLHSHGQDHFSSGSGDATSCWGIATWWSAPMCPAWQHLPWIRLKRQTYTSLHTRAQKASLATALTLDQTQQPFSLVLQQEPVAVRESDSTNLITSICPECKPGTDKQPDELFDWSTIVCELDMNLRCAQFRVMIVS